MSHRKQYKKRALGRPRWHSRIRLEKMSFFRNIVRIGRMYALPVAPFLTNHCPEWKIWVTHSGVSVLAGILSDQFLAKFWQNLKFYIGQKLHVKGVLGLQKAHRNVRYILLYRMRSSAT